ncbi:glycosyltransferase family 2 protein [Marinomonas pollencensis]|uniref:Rhamnosyltransferase n=1 Tax=Marinomonas pollencensis TaxID=491954 RepID=A0A3E0D8E3_9GAMM|nr:glycosyltransferase [Marinomonas pollencensis]REG78355.1 rhamnosyltransferase [Marinomonas pollencensis]
MDITVVIPTYNGGELWKEALRLLVDQEPAIYRIKVIDSSSSDGTREISESFGVDVEVIESKNFDHGGTRSNALNDIDTKFVVFLTQDALLVDKFSIEQLISVFDEDESVQCVYGRQLPHINANPLAQHARYRNYKKKSYITSLNDAYPEGFQKSFFSNSFSAYRTDFLRSIGGFPNNLILGEDVYVAAKALFHGNKVAYKSTAEVMHSHNYAVKEEFSRYFDIGVFHATQPWILKELGPVEGKGFSFALDQIKYLLSKKEYKWLLSSIFSSLAKFIGYKLGKHYKILGKSISRKMSMYKSYWNNV